MNVENLFVKSGDQAAVADIVVQCLANPAGQPDWGLPSSYSPLLVNDPKRKVAISPLSSGWIAIIESKEVVDFGMAKRLVDELGGMAVVVQVADAIGAVGMLVYECGQVTVSRFDEDANDPLNDARAFLKEQQIPFDLCLFHEVIRLTTSGWLAKQLPSPRANQ